MASLPWTIGMRKAKELLITAENIGAEDAWRLGMINRIVPADELDEAVHKFAQTIVKMPRETTYFAKLEVNRVYEIAGLRSAQSQSYDLNILAKLTQGRDPGMGPRAQGRGDEGGAGVARQAVSGVRRRRGPARNLDPLFKPQSIAVVGAAPTSVGGHVLENIKRIGYRGRVYPVHPRHDSVHGLTCYPSLAALPEAVDAAVLATRAEAVPAALAEAGERGVRAAVSFAMGFTEAGAEGERRQREIQEIAARYGMLMCGPELRWPVQLRQRLRDVCRRSPRRGFAGPDRRGVPERHGVDRRRDQRPDRPESPRFDRQRSRGRCRRVHVLFRR